MSDLRRPQLAHQGPRRVFTVTRIWSDVDLPGFGHVRIDMSDQDDPPAARNARCASGPRAGRAAARDDERCKRQCRRSEFPSADDPAWARCTVKSNEDLPRHIYCLFLLLYSISLTSHARRTRSRSRYPG
jgi:hypothetical protein